MKTCTYWILLLLLAAGPLAAQVVLINSPDSLVGNYNFTTSFANNWGADMTTDIWTGDGVFVDDGSANPKLGCNPLVNGEALVGKIALINRGTCDFSLKAYHAQQAGAIAAIIFNNIPGGIVSGMLGLANADQVTIPVVMLSYELGQSVMSALTAGATVNFTLGNIVFANDLAVSLDSILVAPYGAYPASQIRAAGDFVVQPGAIVNNIGANIAAGVTLTAAIDYVSRAGDTTRVYEESDASVIGLETGTTSDLVVLPEFDVFTSGMGIGTYVLSYSVAGDSTETLSAGDNTVATKFDITEGILSKATINLSDNLPNFTIGYARAAGPPVEFVNFFDVPYGEGYQVDSVYFGASIGTGLSLVGKVFDVFLYQWDDVNQDSIINNDEISILGLYNHLVPATVTGASFEIKVPLLDINTLEEASIPLENDKFYGVGVRYQGTDQVFISFDQNVDYSLNTRFLADSDDDVPYIVTAVFNDLLPDIEDNGGLFTNTYIPFAGALYISQVMTGTNDLADEQALDLQLFPNPTSDQLQVDVALRESSDFILYRVLNMQGQLMHQERRSAPTLTDRYTVDVTQLAAGQYVLMVVTDQGVRARSFVVGR